MKFLPTELNVTDYMHHLQSMLNDEECHVFIDTNILSQLYKLNDNARGEFFAWADSIGQRFHIPNWVVIEYNKRVKSNKLQDYVDELEKIKSIKKQFPNLQRFLKGYVDDDILQGSAYHGNKDRLHIELKSAVDSYEVIADVVTKKTSDRIKKVEKDIKLRLERYVVDTDICEIMHRAGQDVDLRFENNIPPGCGDDAKGTNRTGDLIIWREILECCKSNHWSKVIYISRDLKDLYFTPERQIKDGAPIRNNEDKKAVAHESLTSEFKSATGSENIAVIDFVTLLQLLSDKYTDLAFSFQLVSRPYSPTTDFDDNLDWLIDLLSEDSDVEQPAIPSEVIPEVTDAENLEYQVEAIKDNIYLETCNDKELKKCIEGLKSYNWYTQNDAVEELYGLLNKVWEDDVVHKNAFFVIGRNLLQSADGNAFEAVRFIRNMANTLKDKPDYLKKAIIDGCLFEVFYNSHGEIRRKGFKAHYFDVVVEQAQLCLKEGAFTFINECLSRMTTRFVPVVGSDNNYTFVFEIQPPVDEFSDFRTVSLTINGQDSSESFSKSYSTEFACHDEINHKLSQYYAVPEDKIEVNGIPNELNSLRFIKEESENDPFV